MKKEIVYYIFISLFLLNLFSFFLMRWSILWNTEIGFNIWVTNLFLFPIIGAITAMSEIDKNDKCVKPKQGEQE